MVGADQLIDEISNNKTITWGCYIPSTAFDIPKSKIVFGQFVSRVTWIL